MSLKSFDSVKLDSFAGELFVTADIIRPVVCV